MAHSARNLCVTAVAGCIFLVASAIMPSASPASASPTGAVKTPVPLFDPRLEWPLVTLQADQLWSRGEGAGISVAVVDTGIDPVPDLVGAVVNPESGNNIADEAHGTAVAGLIAARGLSGQIAGLAPEASLIDIPVAKEPDDVKSWQIAAGINRAVQLGARIINVSLTSRVSDPKLRTAVSDALTRGCLVVASAGDTGQPQYPADYHYPEVPYPGVLAVGEANQDSVPLTSLIAFGSSAIYAPGRDIYSVGVSPGPMRPLSGSAYATAFVSAAAAVLLSADRRLTPQGTGQLLLQTASLVDLPPSGSLDLPLPGGLGLYPTGNLDPFAALQRLFPPRPPPPPRPVVTEHSIVGLIRTILLSLAIVLLLALITVAWRHRRLARSPPVSLDEPW